jgi:hypothetical protein
VKAISIRDVGIGSYRAEHEAFDVIEQESGGNEYLLGCTISISPSSVIVPKSIRIKIHYDNLLKMSERSISLYENIPTDS